MIGQTLGAYRIVEQIGAGGMATVYKAYHAAMDRYVAVKVLPAHFAQDPTFVQRFKREARLIAKLEHSHILPVYDFGEQEGITYLVMRYLDAGTLAQLIGQGGPLSLRQAADFLAQMGSALNYAHRHNIIHRDIKPSNVLIDREGGAFISDFGISKMVGGTQDLTGTGMIGTPAYMAPEQGLGQPATPLTDQYSLGVVLYEMVTGRVPFHAETPMAVLLMHANAPLPLPGQARPGLPDDVERVILKALAKEPADRFADCTGLADAFDQSVRGLPVHLTLRPQAIEEARAPTPPAAITPPVAPDVSARDGATVPMPSTVAAPAPPRRGVPIWLWPVMALVGVGAVSAALFFGPGRPVPPEEEVVVAPAEEVAEPVPAALTSTPAPTPGPVAVGEKPEGRLVTPCLWIDRGEGLCIRASGGEVTQLLQDSELTFHGTQASWSPDGERLAFGALEPGEPEGGGTSIYVMRADGTALTEIPSGRNNLNVAWSPDGEWLAFHSSGGLALVRPDGSGFRMLYDSFGATCVSNPQWSPDSKRIAAAVNMRDCDYRLPFPVEVWIFSLESQEPISLASIVIEDGPCADARVAFSPDGKQVAYHDAACNTVIVNADGSGQPAPLAEWPEWWRSDFFPQWSEAHAAEGEVEPRLVGEVVGMLPEPIPGPAAGAAAGGDAPMPPPEPAAGGPRRDSRD